jgi:UDP-N-acetylmuramoyl-tripeptide--D-alanyl-D-alanine ligase
VHPHNKKFFSEDEIEKFHVNFYEIFPEKLFELPFNQDHLIENFLVARQVARYVGASEEQILKEAKELTLSEHRFENKKIKKLKSSIFIDDSYNSNPFALKISLIQFGKLKKCGRKIAVIGEMKELGALSKMAHQEAAIFVKFNIDELLCFGKESYPLYETATSLGVKSHYFEEKTTLVNTLYSLLKDGDSVLFKGSNSNKLWEAFEMLKTKFE